LGLVINLKDADQDLAVVGVDFLVVVMEAAVVADLPAGKAGGVAPEGSSLPLTRLNL